MNSIVSTQVLVIMMGVLIMIHVTDAFPGMKKSGESANTDISWGKTTSHCDENDVMKSTKEKTYRAPSPQLPIVGIFATRYDKTSFVWGEGVIKGTQTCKNICYKDARVYYSVLLGTKDAPQTIDMKFGTKSKEICGYGYKVKVCYAVAPCGK